MTATLRGLVREAHPHHQMEPLDATAPTDLSLVSPTVIIEVVGAREGIDALARVRRVASDAPVAAVRISAIDSAHRGALQRSSTWRSVSGTVVALAAIAATGAIVAVGIAAARSSDGGAVPESVMVTIVGCVGAPPLSIAAIRGWRRARRAPAERRRHFERRRSITVIAVASADETTASSLASSVRRELDNAHTGDSHYDVRVFAPRGCAGGAGQPHDP